MIIVDKPPIFDRARKVFGPIVDGAIFAWGYDIYNPKGFEISSVLLAHENIHAQQQADYGIEFWWDTYLKNESFRLSQEIPAHIAEYKEFCKGNHTRNSRRLYLLGIAKRLASALYGNLITPEKAKALIKADSKESIFDPFQ